MLPKVDMIRIRKIQLAEEMINCAVTPADSLISRKIISDLNCQFFL
ncbi:MAG: hypothetical protein MZV64_60840 [Ignavibacteriales bacterium]|nr:hypothetical protein [Ignavibacteriales bacterium]